MDIPELVELAEALGSHVAVRRLPPEVRGKFRGQAGIAIDPSLGTAENTQQLAATLAHEVGHLIDWLPDEVLARGNLLGRLRALRHFLQHRWSDAHGEIRLAPIKRELRALSALWRPWDPETASESVRRYRQSAKELYADALSALLTNPALVERQAPQFWQAWFEGLDQKTEVATAYFGLQDILMGERRTVVQWRRDRLLAGFKAGQAKAIDVHRAKVARKRWQWASFIPAFKNSIIDSLSGLRDALKAADLPPDLESGAHAVGTELHQPRHVVDRDRRAHRPGSPGRRRGPRDPRRSADLPAHHLGRPLRSGEPAGADARRRAGTAGPSPGTAHRDAAHRARHRSRPRARRRGGGAGRGVLGGPVQTRIPTR